MQPRTGVLTRWRSDWSRRPGATGLVPDTRDWRSRSIGWQARVSRPTHLDYRNPAAHRLRKPVGKLSVHSVLALESKTPSSTAFSLNRRLLAGNHRPAPLAFDVYKILPYLGRHDPAPFGSDSWLNLTEEGVK